VIDEDVLRRHLAEHLPAQRWFGAPAVDSIESVRELDGKVTQAIVRGSDGGRYQAVVGVCDDGSIIDATTDAELSLAIFHQAMPDESVS
jgi:hypothetical protein